MIAEMTLDSFEETRGRISRLDLPVANAVRLKALGLFEGQEVQLARRGNPVILKAAGGKIALAREIAHQIFMRACDE